MTTDKEGSQPATVAADPGALPVDAIYWQGEPTTFTVKRYLPMPRPGGGTTSQWIERPADLDLYGVIDPAILARKLELGKAAKVDAKHWYPLNTTIGDFIFDVLAHNEAREEKDGDAVVFGAPVGGVRSEKTIPHVDVIMVDYDNGSLFMDVARWVRDRRLLAVMYPSWNDGSVRTDVARDKIVEFLKKGQRHTPGQEIEAKDVCDYLRAEKGYLDSVLVSAAIEKVASAEKGTTITLRHEPIDKFRLVLFPKERFAVAHRPGCDTDAEAIEEYKDRFRGLCQMIGVHYDKAATDISRLMYLPSHHYKRDFVQLGLQIFWHGKAHGIVGSFFTGHIRP